MPNNFENQNIYAFNVLKSLDANFDNNYSFLISTLLHLESELEYGITSIVDFAEHLLTTINQSKAFRKLDRVCLAITHPGSSRLSVLSSYNSERLRKNEMLPGYSCFVSRQSSLFKTHKSNIRIYSDIDGIVNVYGQQPVQRSLDRLQKMGVKSGITVPLSISNLVSGLLFLNSTVAGSFSDLVAEDYAALCLIKLVALSCLKKALFGINGLDDTLGKVLTSIHQHKNVFSADEFGTKLFSIIESRFNKKIQIKVSNGIGQNFLFALNPAVYTVIKVLESLTEVPRELAIEFNKTSTGGSDFVQVSINDLAIGVDQCQRFQDLQLFTSQQIEVLDGHIKMTSPLELCEQTDYSV